MKLKIQEINDACTGCGACVSICPKGCLQLLPNNEGFFYPFYDYTNCVKCHLCENTCHILANTEHHSPDPESFYLYRSKETAMLQASSSGGGFSMFADWILKQGGVVYGSCYNGENERLEVYSTDQIDLKKLRKSKYIESYTGNIFASVRKHLQSDRRVLYCGTPCQVRGLKQYLFASKTSTDLLLTIDFACHGVPSNKYFKLFKQMFENQKKKVTDVDFRYKDFSKSDMMWHNMTLRLGFNNGSERIYSRFSYYYYYYEPFLDNLFLRKSCYNCDIARHSDADISLGDFWGINKHRTELDDNKGMSFVCINNPKYISLYEELSKNDFSEKLPYKAIEYQYKDNRERRAKQLIIRNNFIKQVDNLGYKKAILNHYGRIKIYKIMSKIVIKRIIKQVIGR